MRTSHRCVSAIDGFHSQTIAEVFLECKRVDVFLNRHLDERPPENARGWETSNKAMTKEIIAAKSAVGLKNWIWAIPPGVTLCR